MSEQSVEASLEGQVIQGQAGQYYVVKRHAKGGMAWIYRAIDQRDQESVALKIMFDKLRRDAKIFERFMKEIDVHMGLVHPNIIRLIEPISTDAVMGLSMEWVDGGDLKELLASQDGPLPMDVVEQIFFPLLDAMGFAHKQNIVHRDIKPGNVLLTRVLDQWVPKLTDFGIAKTLTQPGVTFTGAKLGTPHYMAPEQWRDSKSVDHRADIYSLGVILYRMVTGKLPFDGNYHNIITKLLEEQAPYPDGVEAPLAGVILRCLEKDPSERFDSCEILASTLRRVLAMIAPQGRPGAGTLALGSFSGGDPLGDDEDDATIPMRPSMAADLGIELDTVEREPLFADDAPLKPRHKQPQSPQAPQAAALSDFNKTAAWGEDEIAAAISDEELEKSIKKAQAAKSAAAEASLRTVALDADDPEFQRIKASFDQQTGAASSAPLPIWLLVLLGVLMLAVGGLIGWFFSRG